LFESEGVYTRFTWRPYICHRETIVATGRRRRRRPSLGSRENVAPEWQMTRSARDDNATPSGTSRVTRPSSRRSIDSFGDIERRQVVVVGWWPWWCDFLVASFPNIRQYARPYKLFCSYLTIEQGCLRADASGELRYTSPSKSNGCRRRIPLFLWLTYDYPRDSMRLMETIWCGYFR